MVTNLVEAAHVLDRAAELCTDLTLYPAREQRVQVALIRDAARSLAQACRELARELRDGADSA